MIDRRILGELERDGRISFTELSERVGLSKSPCWNRVQAHEAAGLITGYRATLDMAKLGLDTLAFVEATVAFDQHDRFELAVNDHSMIVACHATVGDADYLLQVVARSMIRLDDFLRAELWRLPGVQRFTTKIAMRTIKRDAQLTSAIDA
jgi:Lrp/AsnC family leucine-responsive transcriptional regulator